MPKVKSGGKTKTFPYTDKGKEEAEEYGKKKKKVVKRKK